MQENRVRSNWWYMACDWESKMETPVQTPSALSFRPFHWATLAMWCIDRFSLVTTRMRIGAAFPQPFACRKYSSRYDNGRILR